MACADPVPHIYSCQVSAWRGIRCELRTYATYIILSVIITGMEFSIAKGQFTCKFVRGFVTPANELRNGGELLQIFPI